MIYKAKDFDHLFGLKGFSDELLANHFKLYEGYVKNSNKFIQKLDDLFKAEKVEELEYTEIKRRLTFELNGIKLHEYYFGNMNKKASELDPKSSLAQKMSEEFGSVQNWKKNFKGAASIRGIGWGVMIYDPEVDLLFNTWVEEHHMGNVAGTTPILIMDLWEHAMMLDYGTDRASYVDAFFKAIDWNVVAGRFEEARNLKGALGFETDLQKVFSAGTHGKSKSHLQKRNGHHVERSKSKKSISQLVKKRF